MNLETIEATYRVTTPMFCGGADNTTAEFRLASFKGTLRFWWRALAWQRLGGDLQKIHTEESELFGSTDTGQAKFLLRATPPALSYQQKGQKLCDPETGRSVGKGAKYLAYGAVHFSGDLERDALDPFEFTVEALPKPSITDTQRASLERAMRAVGLFGGMGSKSRKGYGSLSLVKWRGEHIDPGTQEYFNQVWAATDGIAGQHVKEIAEYTAFSPQTKLLLLLGRKGESPMALLNAVGREMVWFRSNGRTPKHSRQREVLGETVTADSRRFWDDHDLMEVVAQGRKTSKAHPERVAFGLPHNYYFSNSGKADVTPDKAGRRASPLFFHIHQMDSDQFGVLVSFFPARFLPEGEKLRVGRSKVDVSDGREQEFWKPINEFFQELQPPVIANEKKTIITKILEVGL